MCDRPLPQQQLCADLAGLIWVFPHEQENAGKVVTAWLRGFWATMAREWTTGIDVLRMEKFLLLVRRVLGASLVWMQVRQEEESQSQKAPQKSTRASKKRTANGETKKPTTTTNATTTVRWNKTRVDAILGLLADWPLRPSEDTTKQADEDNELMPKMVPVGLKLHALDIWVDEAEKAGLLLASTTEIDQESSSTKKQETTTKSSSFLSSSEVLDRLHNLVKTLRAETHSTAVRIRSKESLADERLPWNQTEEGQDEKDGEEWGGLDD